MVAKSKGNYGKVMELVGQVLRVKKSTGSHHIADLYKSNTIDQDTKKEVPIYSIISNNVLHFTTGDTILEVIADFMWQCDSTDCQAFVEPKIFNAHLLEMVAEEKAKTEMKET